MFLTSPLIEQAVSLKTLPGHFERNGDVSPIIMRTLSPFG
jgi:hypothetical protein